MPRTPQNFVMSLETLYWQVDPVPDGVLGGGHEVLGVGFYLWPVFFKIDGTTTRVSAARELTGTATVTAETDIGRLVGLSANSSGSTIGSSGWPDTRPPTLISR